MKVRQGFVTNSSSSSFIVHFKNNQDKIEKTGVLGVKYPKYVSQVLTDIEENKVTYTEALKYLKEHVKWNVYYKLKYYDSRFSGKSYDWYQESQEFKDAVKSEMDKTIEQFKNSVNHRGQFAIVSYSDHSTDGSELEHHIMPKMPFVVYVINNH